MSDYETPTIMTPNIDVIKMELPPVEGFIIFQKSAVTKQLLELYRTLDIITATNYADACARDFPGTEFLLYSGTTGKWYTYYKPKH